MSRVLTLRQECPKYPLYAIGFESVGRVRERRCRRSLPSEPDVRLSPHPAQAATKPRVSGAGRHVVTVSPLTILACSLLASADTSSKISISGQASEFGWPGDTFERCP